MARLIIAPLFGERFERLNGRQGLDTNLQSGLNTIASSGSKKLR